MGRSVGILCCPRRKKRNDLLLAPLIYRPSGAERFSLMPPRTTPPPFLLHGYPVDRRLIASNWGYTPSMDGGWNTRSNEMLTIKLSALEPWTRVSRRFSIVLRCPPYIYGVWNGFVGRGGRTGILPDKWNMFRFGCLCALTRCHKIYIFILYLRKMKFYLWGTRKLDSSLVIFNIFTWRSFLILKSGSFFFFFIWYNW